MLKISKIHFYCKIFSMLTLLVSINLAANWVFLFFSNSQKQHSSGARGVYTTSQQDACKQSNLKFTTFN